MIPVKSPSILTCITWYSFEAHSIDRPFLFKNKCKYKMYSGLVRVIHGNLEIQQSANTVTFKIFHFICKVSQGSVINDSERPQIMQNLYTNCLFEKHDYSLLTHICARAVSDVQPIQKLPVSNLLGHQPLFSNTELPKRYFLYSLQCKGGFN